MLGDFGENCGVWKWWLDLNVCGVVCVFILIMLFVLYICCWVGFVWVVWNNVMNLDWLVVVWLDNCVFFMYWGCFLVCGCCGLFFCVVFLWLGVLWLFCLGICNRWWLVVLVFLDWVDWVNWDWLVLCL